MQHRTEREMTDRLT